jgi:hypothetical protein
MQLAMQELQVRQFETCNEQNPSIFMCAPYLYRVVST